MYAEILNWNPIPDKLIEFDVDNIKKLINDSPFKDLEWFQQYKISNHHLLNFIQPFFNFNVFGKSYYQIIKNGIKRHVDVGRSTAYNFLINTGGDDVYTVWYDYNRVEEIYKIKIPIKTWHKLDVSICHSVEGITDTRIAISVFETNENNNSNT
jgi:hypothetical protein